MWLKKCLNNESTYNNAKATAYMCDPDNWKEYKVGIANYAVGGATIELLIASWNKSQGLSIELLDEDVNKKGITYNKPIELVTSNPLQINVKNGVYNLGRDYWLASPSNTSVNAMRDIYSDGFVGNNKSYANSSISLRPIVSIPTSKITVNGDTVTVNQ